MVILQSYIVYDTSAVKIRFIENAIFLVTWLLNLLNLGLVYKYYYKRRLPTFKVIFFFFFNMLHYRFRNTYFAVWKTPSKTKLVFSSLCFGNQQLEYHISARNKFRFLISPSGIASSTTEATSATASATASASASTVSSSSSSTSSA